MNAEIELYAQGNSLLHRWEPRWKLVALFILMFSFAQFNQLLWACVGLLIGYGLLLLLQLPFRILYKRLGTVHLIFVPCFIILPFTANGGVQEVYGVHVSWDGIWMALLFYIRAVSVVALSMALIYSTPMTRLFHAAEQLWIPKVIVQIAVLTYRYLFSLSWEYANVRNALKSRGFVNRASMQVYHTYANVIASSLVRSLERTDRVYHAMQCRGYQGHVCLMNDQQTQILDMIMFVVCVCTALIMVSFDLHLLH